eukprot:2354618-Heterocapsa_arctica.AAC.1
MIKEQMTPMVRDVIADKKILLLQEMLRDAGHPDEHLAADIAAGFPLVGDLGISGAFELRDKPATLSTAQLMASARWAQEASRALCRSTGDDAMDRAVFDGTMEEVDK